MFLKGGDELRDDRLMEMKNQLNDKSVVLGHEFTKPMY